MTFEKNDIYSQALLLISFFESELKKNVKLRSNLVSSNKIHFDEMFQEIWKVSKLSLNAYLNEYLKKLLLDNNNTIFIIFVEFTVITSEWKHDTAK